MEIKDLETEVVKLTGDTSIKGEFFRLDMRQTDMLNLLDKGELDEVDKLLSKYEKSLRQMVAANNKVLRQIRKMRTWKAKAGISEREFSASQMDRNRFGLDEMETETLFRIKSTDDVTQTLILQDNLKDIKNMKSHGSKGSILDIATRAVNSLTEQVLELDKKHIKLINSKIYEGFRQYRFNKLKRDLSHLLFEIFIGLIIITISLGYVVNLIPITWLSVIVLPAVLWFVQRKWVNKWLDKKLSIWRTQNLRMSIVSYILVRKYSKCLIVVTDYLAVRVTTVRDLITS